MVECYSHLFKYMSDSSNALKLYYLFRTNYNTKYFGTTINLHITRIINYYSDNSTVDIMLKSFI